MARVAARARPRPSPAGSSIPISSATIRTACFACPGTDWIRTARCGPIRRRRWSSTARLSPSSMAIQLRPGHRRVRHQAWYREGEHKGHRDDWPSQLRAPRARRRLGGHGGRGRSGFAALSQHVGRAVRGALRRQRPPALDQSDHDRRAHRRRRSGRARRDDIDGGRRQADGGAQQRRAQSRKDGSSTGRRATTHAGLYYDGALLTVGAQRGPALPW